MKKYILILFLLCQFSFAEKLPVINQLSDIPPNKNVILIFSLKYCPYCERQEKSIIKKVQPKFPNVAYLKVIKGTPVYDKLIKTGNFGEVEYYPTTFILTKDTDNSIYVKYPFKGEQRSKAIIGILNNKDIMED